MRAKSRILILTPRFPYPVIGGDRLRIHAICRSLARSHSLTLLSLCESRDELDPNIVSDDVFDRIERVHLPKWRSFLQVAAAIPGQTPLQVAYYHSSEFARRVARLAPEHDLVLAHLIRTGDYLIGRDYGPAVLEMTDAISMNYARAREHGSPGLRGRIYALEQKRLNAYERRMTDAFNCVSLIAEGDAHHLWGNKLPENLVIASNGVDCHALPYRRRQDNAPIAVFIGNMHSAQNMDACRHFVTSILPALAHADLTEFRVVGRIRQSDAAWLRQHPRVTITGEVASVPHAVEDARYGICSVRIGAGVQNKILEYMALGLPVITSPVGYEGLAATNGRDLLVAETPDDYVVHIRHLNQDTAFHRLLSKNGRNFVESHHDWEVSLSPLTERIREISTSRQTQKA